MGTALALFLLVAGLWAPVGAQSLDVSLGFAGRVAVERWAPLRVSCDGAPADSILELLQLDRKGHAESIESFEVPAASTIEWPVPVGISPGIFLVRLREGELILAERRVDSLPLVYPGHLVLSLGLPSDVERALATALMPLEPIGLCPISASELPIHAIDLDAIAGIGLVDPGRTLSPARLTALRAWLAAGGRLVVLAARGAKEGMATDLGFPGLRGRGRYGLGEILCVAEGPGDYAAAREPSFWKTALALVPYGSDSRISPGRLPETFGLGPSPGSPIASLNPFVVGAGGLWTLGLLFAARTRRGLGAMALLSLLAILCVFAAMGPLERSGAGRVLARTRALVLEDGSAFLEYDIQRLRPRGPSSLGELVRERPLELTFASGDTALLGTGDAPPALRHSGYGPDIVVPRRGGSEGGSFVSWLPSGSLAVGGSGRDLVEKNPPARSDALWLEALRARFPNLEFRNRGDSIKLPRSSLGGKVFVVTAEARGEPR